MQQTDKNKVWTAVSPKAESQNEDLVARKATGRRTERSKSACSPRRPQTRESKPPPLPAGRSAYQRINEVLVGQLLANTGNASVPGGDRMGAEIVKVMWGRITALVRAFIALSLDTMCTWKVGKRQME